ncbi:MAG: molybdenum cofactor cytidylyltransferase [Paracoccaceae bacterium]|jgi:molybdenum cofactor cytidylyltransferase
MSTAQGCGASRMATSGDDGGGGDLWGAIAIPVLILAAGASSRMRGRDKLLEPIDGVPLLLRQVRAALQVSAKVIVALPPEPHPRHALLDDCQVMRLPVADAAKGMSFSLRAGIRAVPAGSTHVLVVLADLPELTSADMAAVMDARLHSPDALAWRATGANGRAGHPILFAQSLFEAFNQLRGDQGAQPVLTAIAEDVHFVSLPDLHAVTDLDTPEDWADWRNATGR